MSAEQIRESARAETQDGREVPLPAGAVDAMIRFEERYGGLCYQLLSTNGMEHGLDGDASVILSDDGWIVASIVDGDQTWPVNVLLDGRTVTTLGGRPRIINSSLDQRLASHAQLAQVRRRPHVALGLVTPPGQEPAIDGTGLPAIDAAATGPADRWWGDDEAAVHLEACKWWGSEDFWVVRCFTHRAEDLPALVEASRRALPGAAWRDEKWCTLCSQARRPEQPCLPETDSTTHI
jgi:hypothetical protein